MIRILLFTVLISLITTDVWNQDLFSVTKIDNLKYPEGIYKSKNDFIQKTPSDTSSIKVKNRFPKEDIDTLIRRCFFINEVSGKKIKKAFAIVHHGKLYFRTGAILENLNTNDQALSPATSASNQFVLVLIGGDNYLYSEAGIINHWDAGIKGGIRSNIYISNYQDNDYYTNTMGFVWDHKAKKFDVFRNCEDFVQFMRINDLKEFDCSKQKITFDDLVKYIDMIK